ncbi:pyridoxal phosphate phosphatase [Corythoichthys intestinalis]|uniref:pyridoxal phosphate phosphatase n=1 Tax=Corythoichthys intestinalis TaxID=161448 RepID=UPI0025A5C137|nr:pyridoxal phosphate phosphatase [Corythoichthys intestinalis]XP_061804314.1 chronophin-like [Nerophis lumbriciformis]
MAVAFGFKGCRKIGGAQIRALLEAKEFFLFDCDGVLWHGEKAVAGAAQVVNSLMKQGKNVVFVTNNSTRPREKYLHKFYRLGFTAVALEHIFSSSYCSALYLRDVAKLRGQVFVVGCDGLRDELREAGIPCVEEADEPGATIYDCALAADVKAVLVGHDDRLTFLKLAKASCYLKDPECLFLATDNDPWHPLSSGRILPGSGSLMAALEVASGRKATVIGKPSRFMFECISSQFPGVDPTQCLMVGDRLETDMLFGSNCGLDTMLTLTGVSQMEEANQYGNSEVSAHQSLVPDYVVDTIADFLPAFEELEEQSN